MTMISEETKAKELSRLVTEFDYGERQNRNEAWNLIAEFAYDNAEEICEALSLRTSPPPSGEAGEVTIDALLNAYDAETATVPLGHEHIGRGRSTYNWRREVVRELRELSKALPTIKEPTDGK